MKITRVLIFLLPNEPKLKAFASLIIDEQFVVHEIRIIQGREHLFLMLPYRMKKNGESKALVDPLTNEARRMIEEAILVAYTDAISLDPPVSGFWERRFDDQVDVPR